MEIKTDEMGIFPINRLFFTPGSAVFLGADTWIDKHADRHGHLSRSNQIIENRRCVVLHAVQTDKQTSRFRCIVRRRDINPIIARGHRIDLRLIGNIHDKHLKGEEA